MVQKIFSLCDSGCTNEHPEGHYRDVDVGRELILVDELQMARCQEAGTKW